MSWTTRVLSGATAAALLIAGATAARAAQIVTDCQFSCTADCELASDITCISGDGIGVYNGAAIDLKGHSIICNDPFTVDHDCSATAITIVSPNSVVKDTGVPKGGIVGSFFKGVDCLSKAGAKVSGIVIDGVDGTAIYHCPLIENNVLIGAEEQNYPSNPAIDTSGVATSGDFVRNNYVLDFGATGIKVSGTKPMSVDHNIINPRLPVGGTFSTGIAVNLATSTALSVDHNAIIGNNATPIVGNTTATFADNHCDVTNPNCAACISSHYCTTPAIDFCREDEFVLKPSQNGDENSFTILHPSSPAVPASLRWVLVNDYPDASNGGLPATSIINYGGGAHMELFHLQPIYPIEDTRMFSNCTIKAHLATDGTSTTAYLVVKLGGTQSDGNAVTVTTNSYTLEYTRLMPTKPGSGSLPWSTDDLADFSLQIGVKQTSSAVLGVTVGDLELVCE